MKIFIKVSLLALLLQTSLFSREINLNKLLNNAEKTNKHLFVWLHKNGCGYCDNMYEFTLEDENIKSLVEKEFNFVHINISHSDRVVYKEFVGSGRKFAKYFGFDFYPTSLFFDKKSDLVHKVLGFRDEDLFYKALKFVQTRSYYKMDYNTFENYFDFNQEEL